MRHAESEVVLSRLLVANVEVNRLAERHDLEVELVGLHEGVGEGLDDGCGRVGGGDGLELTM